MAVGVVGDLGLGVGRDGAGVAYRASAADAQATRRGVMGSAIGGVGRDRQIGWRKRCGKIGDVTVFINGDASNGGWRARESRSAWWPTTSACLSMPCPKAESEILLPVTASSLMAALSTAPSASSLAPIAFGAM